MAGCIDWYNCSGKCSKDSGEGSKDSGEGSMDSGVIEHVAGNHVCRAAGLNLETGTGLVQEVFSSSVVVWWWCVGTG